MAAIAWRNRDNLGYAWKVLNEGRVRRLRVGRGRPPRLDDQRCAFVHGPAEPASVEHHAGVGCGAAEMRPAVNLTANRF